jgi:hypothetical protein
MKKLTHLSFPQVFGIKSNKRLVYENPGETEALALTGLEASKEADIDAMAKEGQKGLDKALTDGNSALDRKAAEYKKKYEVKDDADAANKAIDAALATAKAKLAAKHKAAGETLKSNAVTASNEAANKLVEDRKQKAKDKFPDSHLEKVSVGDSSLDTKLPDEKEFENEDMSDAAFKEVMVSMLRAVYIAEGEEAANKLSEKMRKMGKIGFGEKELKYDEDFKLAQGVEHNPPLIQFDPDVTSGDYNSRHLAGKIFGLNHAADNTIKDEAAREAYKKYIADEGRKVGQAKDAAGVDAIMTPAEWLKANPSYQPKEVNEKEEEDKLAKERLAKVNDHLAKIPASRTWESEQLKGILLARLHDEKDPAKWDAIMNEVGAKACGMGVDEYKSTSWADIDKSGKITGISELVKAHGDAMGKYALDEGKNHDGKTRGYITGLVLAAEERFKDNPVMLKRYKEQLKAAMDSEDFQKKVAQNLEDSDHYSRRQRDLDWNNPANLQSNIKEMTKLGEANNAIFDAARKELLSPDQYAQKEKDKQEEKAKGSPREAFVDGLLENIPAEKGKERDVLRGILMAAIGPKENKDGSVKTPEEMGKIIEPILEHMGFSKDKGYETVDMEKLNKVLEGRNDFGDHGKKMDDTSKGYYAALIYQAEQTYKDNPKGLEAYKKHLKDAVNSDSFKSSTEDKLAKIKKYQDYLEDPVLSKRLTEEDKRTYREGIAKLTDEVFMETRKATKWPEDFAKDFEKTDRSETLKGNREFLDKYGMPDKLDAANSKKSLDAIIGGIPKEKVTDANKKAVDDKKKELAGKLAKAKNESERLQVLAEAADYSARVADEKADEKRYKVAIDNYIVTGDILSNTDTKKYPKYLKHLAKGLGLKEDDPAVKKALREAEDAKEEDRAAVMAAQVLELYKAAPANDKGEKPSTSFTKEDFDYYSQYMNEKKEAAKAKKKSSTGGGGAPSVGGGGAPAPGGQGGPGAVPPGKKETPEPGKEKPPEQTPFEQAKSALVGTLASFISQMKQFPELGITSAPALTAKVSEEVGKRVTGLDLSKVPDQTISVAGGKASITIAGGKVSQINVAPWAETIYAKSQEKKEETEPPKESDEKQKQLVAKLSSYAAQHYQAWIESMHGESGVRGKFQQEMSYYVQSQGLDLSVLDKPYQVCMYGFVTPQQKPKNVVVSVSKSGVSVRTLDAKTA